MNKCLFILITLIGLSSGLRAQQYQFPWGKKRVAARPVDTVNYYFPLFKSSDNIMPNTATVIRRSAQLRALHEPVIFYDNTADQIFRFTWLRSGDHPIAIRLVLHDNHTTIYWKECNGTGDGEPGKLIVEKQKELDNSAWHQFRKLGKNINLCKIDTSYKALPGKTSEWLLEGVAGGYYQLDETKSPGPASTLYKCCDYLIELTDLAVTPDKKY